MYKLYLKISIVLENQQVNINIKLSACNEDKKKLKKSDCIDRKQLEKLGEEELSKLLVEKDKQLNEMNDLLAAVKQDHRFTAERLR